MLYNFNFLFSRCPVYMTAGRQGEDNTAGKFIQIFRTIKYPPAPLNIFRLFIRMYVRLIYGGRRKYQDNKDDFRFKF